MHLSAPLFPWPVGGWLSPLCLGKGRGRSPGWASPAATAREHLQPLPAWGMRRDSCCTWLAFPFPEPCPAARPPGSRVEWRHYSWRHDPASCAPANYTLVAESPGGACSIHPPPQGCLGGQDWERGQRKGTVDRPGLRPFSSCITVVCVNHLLPFLYLCYGDPWASGSLETPLRPRWP